MLEIQLQRLFREQVDRHRIAGESVRDEQIVVLRRLAFEGEPAVAYDDLRRSPARRKIKEFPPGYVLDQRIDLIEPDHVSRLRIRGERSRSEADDAHAQGRMA